MKDKAGYSPAYQLVWNSFTNKPSVADATIQQTMLNALVTGGYYAKAELLDVFSAHSNTAGESQKNWKLPGTFDPTLVNAPTWTQYAGFLGAATGTKYVKLNFNPTVNGTLVSQNSICVIIGIGNNVAESNRFDVGGVDAAGVSLIIYSRNTSDRFYTRCNDANASQYISNTTSIGHHAISRTVSTEYKVYKNQVAPVTKSIASTGLTNIELYACGYNNNGVVVPCNKQLRYVFVFSGLIQAEVQAVIGIMETYLDNYSTGLY